MPACASMTVRLWMPASASMTAPPEPPLYRHARLRPGIHRRPGTHRLPAKTTTQTHHQSQAAEQRLTPPLSKHSSFLSFCKGTHHEQQPKHHLPSRRSRPQPTSQCCWPQWHRQQPAFNLGHPARGAQPPQPVRANQLAARTRPRPCPAHRQAQHQTRPQN